MPGIEDDGIRQAKIFHKKFVFLFPVNETIEESSSLETINEVSSFMKRCKMMKAKNFQSGLQMLRQIEFALFDMHIHFDFKPGGNKTVIQLLNDIRKAVAVIIPPDFNRFPNSFAHIFAGGYAAGYYSYKWAEVLSADAYSMFEETASDGVVNAATGARFLEEVLAKGGSRSALESFVAFRGREPELDALLRHNGMEIA